MLRIDSLYLSFYIFLYSSDYITISFLGMRSPSFQTAWSYATHSQYLHLDTLFSLVVRDLQK
nr:MAG TPA: hypothetical protein [Caudoviricetes sp.]